MNKKMCDKDGIKVTVKINKEDIQSKEIKVNCRKRKKTFSKKQSYTSRKIFGMS